VVMVLDHVVDHMWEVGKYLTGAYDLATNQIPHIGGEVVRGGGGVVLGDCGVCDRDADSHQQRVIELESRRTASGRIVFVPKAERSLTSAMKVRPWAGAVLARRSAKGVRRPDSWEIFCLDKDFLAA